MENQLEQNELLFLMYNKLKDNEYEIWHDAFGDDAGTAYDNCN